MLDRRNLLRVAATAPAALLAGVGGGDAAATAPDKPMNILVLLTDQERAEMHFPPGWGEANLPGWNRLRAHGVEFTRAYCNTAMCSASRATFFTGLYPAQHGLTQTLGAGISAGPTAQAALPLDLPTFFTLMRDAGYEVVYKGKWHMSFPADAVDGEDYSELWRPEDIEPYGVTGWNPPDGGDNQEVEGFGGGIIGHDARYMGGPNAPDAVVAGALDYLRAHATAEQPFCLVVSLINPHDVIAYPSTYIEGGYDDSWLQGEIEAPETCWQEYDTRPTVHMEMRRRLAAGLGMLAEPHERRNYLNFYANLMKHVDGYCMQLLDALDELGLTGDTLVVRTSDHGEMGQAHGGLRQKAFNAYEETLHVPLVYSNPTLWPEPRTSDAIVTHVDFVPTVATLAGVADADRPAFSGIDYSALLLDPAAAPVQDHALFTFDDRPIDVPAPALIRCLHDGKWKIAQYTDYTGAYADEWELYDLTADPLETTNLGHPSVALTSEQAAAFETMQARLAEAIATRLQPLA